MKKRTVGFLIGLCVVVVNGAPVAAQFGYPGFGKGVSASASERVSIKPERLRLLMQIKAQGSDAKSALASLTEHKEKVKKELEAMKADKESVVFSPVRVSTGGVDASGNQRRMLQMQMQMMQGRGGKPLAPKPLPTIYTVTCTVKADWPLPVREGDALALLPLTLKDQITNRDIAGEKNKPKLGKAEQEQLEELEAMMSEQNSYGGEQNVRGPSIKFIAKVPEDVQKKATAGAFQKAVKEIESTSAATGVKLGKLTSVTAVVSGQDPNELYVSQRYPGQPDVPSASFLKEEELSVSDENADELVYAVTVAVSFDIE